MLVNEGLPNFVVSQLKTKFDLTTKTVGILGMAFRANSDDKRESLSYKLKKYSSCQQKKVLCSYPYLKYDFLVSERTLIDNSDIIIMGVPHNIYKELDFKNKFLYDIWNFVVKKKKDLTHKE